jgi:hypothetical protein
MVPMRRRCFFLELSNMRFFQSSDWILSTVLGTFRTLYLKILSTQYMCVVQVYVLCT